MIASINLRLRTLHNLVSMVSASHNLLKGNKNTLDMLLQHFKAKVDFFLNFVL